jgi:hypothetical protein
VSRILTEDGPVAHFVATTSSASNTEQQERDTVDQLTALLRKTPPERKKPLFEEAVERINELDENDVTILMAQIGHSIGLFFFATLLQGLQYLHETYSNEQLKSTMQEIFIMLLKTDENTVLDLRVDTLRWDLSNYMDCLTQLYTFMNLPTLSRVYEMAKRNQELIVSNGNDVRSFHIDKFPFELIKMIILRATGHFFVTVSRMTPHAGMYAMATMMAVCFLWWKALTARKYIRRLLRRFFKRFCHPFTYCPQKLTSLHIEDVRGVASVAASKNKLYVVRVNSSEIYTYESEPPFSFLGVLLMKITAWRASLVVDLVVCITSNRLYIACAGSDLITALLLRSTNLLYEDYIKFELLVAIYDWEPLTLSVFSSRLLVTPVDGESLHLYGDDGKLHRIDLPGYMKACHAVETTRNTLGQLCQ